jgi:hypothetical protein
MVPLRMRRYWKRLAGMDYSEVVAVYARQTIACGCDIQARKEA